MRSRFHRVLASVLLSLTATAAAGESNAQPRAPVPQGAALEASQKAAADLYGDRFQSAKTLADKTAVTADMIEAALQLQDGSADQYAARRAQRRGPALAMTQEFLASTLGGRRIREAGPNLSVSCGPTR
jgi:hypothetical protein